MKSNNAFSKVFLATGIVLLIALFIFDIQTPRGLAIGMLYIGIMLQALWTRNLRIIYGTAAISVVLVTLGYFLSPHSPIGTAHYIAIGNRMMAVLIIIVCAVMASKYLNIHQITIEQASEITERIKGEDKFKAILESAPDAIVIVNSEGKIHIVNSKTEKLFGYPRTEIIGKPVEVLIPSRFREAHPAQRNGYMHNPKVRPMGEGIDLFGQHKDGTEFPVAISLSPLKTEEGKLVSAAIRDISRQKAIEKELIEAKVTAEQATIRAEDAQVKAEDAMKSKQQFLANMSHEIRTPMTAIIGFSKVVLKTELTQKQKEYVSAIKTSSDSLLVLINDILDLAKVDAGKMAFEEVPFNMKDEITAMLQLFDLKLQERNLRLETDYDNKIPDQLLGDPVRLNQIILNLVSNAVKFTEAGDIKVTIAQLREDERYVTIRFSVADSGIGIPSHMISTIFENFQQATGSTTRLFGGTGLGLAIVKQLVERQGGTIQVTSKVNEGSTFSFELSFQKTENKVKPESDTLELDPNAHGLNVLVVEDVALNQLLMTILLDEFGFTYEIADNGQLATQLLEKKSFDIILMDLQMPMMNGFEATKHIRDIMHITTPIIALTADVTSEDLARCKAAGMNEHIAKPIDEKLLYSKIVALVKSTAS